MQRAHKWKYEVDSGEFIVASGKSLKPNENFYIKIYKFTVFTHV
jgi:nitrite reductase/ring-hydroxylating ferredoxin subunit